LTVVYGVPRAAVGCQPCVDLAAEQCAVLGVNLVMKVHAAVPCNAFTFCCVISSLCEGGVLGLMVGQLGLTECISGSSATVAY
jgi:hypothetical protein